MIERYSDTMDEAAALTASITDSLVQAARLANAPETHPDFDGETCIDCGDDIPPARLALGRIRCVVCQSAKERRAQGFAMPSTGFECRAVQA